jgi:ubiquinol-cytochrome c reductase cytochrome b subunit
MSAALEQPSTSGFWEQRTGWSLLKRVLLLEPLPGGSRWAAAFGSLLLFAFVLQVVTGILLATNYAPSVDTAWPSVHFIQTEVPLGSFIRAVHHWGSGAMVILLLVHLLQVFIWGAYKKPRELTWMAGVLLLFCTLGLAFTGYLLPWDQKAYSATKVGLGLVGTTPLIGDGLRTLLQGGPQLGNLTLTRFFSLHVFVLPGLLVALVVVHLYLFRLHGVTPPWWASPGQLKAQEEPFWPKQALKDAVLALVFLVGLGVWCWCWPAPLGDRPADPADSSYEPRPEWYFMFYFRLLRYFEGPYEVVGTFVLPLLFFLVLFFWPFLDRNPSRNPLRRPVAMSLLGAGTVGLVGLTIFAVATDARTTLPPQTAAREQEAAKTAEPTKPVRPPQPAGPVQRADVARIYNTKCAPCHGIDGSGTQGRAAMPTFPDFTSLAWQTTQTDLEVTHRIREGSGALMPAYRDELSQQEILALAVYVRAFSIAPDSRQPVQPPPAQVSARTTTDQVYRAFCLACHDTDGSGRIARTALPSLPDFRSNKWTRWWLNARTDEEIQHAILDGKAPFMPPMKDKLSGADARGLTEYVRSFHVVAWWRPGGPRTVDTGPQQPIIPPPQVEPRVVTQPRDTGDTAARTRVAAGLYRQYCLACHGTEGRGGEMKGAMPGLPDFTNRGWQESVNAPRLTASILDGRGTLMPPFRGRLSDEQCQDLAGYVRAFGPAATVTPVTTTDDFDKRYRELQDQWNELERQLKEMSKPPPVP